MKPEKRSVAVVIHHPVHTDRILTVLRPDDDEDLPSTWGLPAASLRSAESWSDAAVRAGREKLGVELRIRGVVGEGRLDRERYVLHMRELEAAIMKGSPDIDQPSDGTTRYRDWAWSGAERLVPAARAGSLCSRIYLRSRDRDY